jgi:hypothetical protein
MARRKTVGKLKQTGKPGLKNSRDIEIEEEARAAYLARLQEDKVFLIESERIESELKELAMNYPATYVKFFKRFSYLSLQLRDEFEKFLGEKVPSTRAKQILQDYADYSRRFRVWLTRRGDGPTRVMAKGPFNSKYRIDIVGGVSRSPDPEAKGVPVFFDGLYADDDLPVPTPQLEEILATGKAKFVQVDDKSGRNVLHDIEATAYDPEAVTVILHNSKRRYLWCLVGENVTIEKTWKAAGAAINSLQAKLYGRRKAGRPRKIKKLKKAIDLRKRDETVPLKQKAFNLDPTATNLATNQVYLSRVNKAVQPQRPQEPED